jgi:hypothetical protein
VFAEERVFRRVCYAHPNASDCNECRCEFVDRFGARSTVLQSSGATATLVKRSYEVCFYAYPTRLPFILFTSQTRTTLQSVERFLTML